jgi:high-affinity iron transporter
MLQSFIISLREGVEAALVIAIAVSYLRKIGRSDLLPQVYRAFGFALIASIAVALALARVHITEEAYEGWTLLVSAAFVLSMVIWMNRHARGVKHQIESELQAKSGEKGSRWGVFLFVFLMVLREGVETVLLLTAAAPRFDTSSVLEIAGIVLGLGLAVLFGVSFVRGTFRIELPSFFRMTTAILLVIVLQLVITGLHELSEGQILPNSRQEMALIGPIVRNDVFFFVIILAMAGTMLLLEWRRRRAPDLQGLEGAARRKQAWSAKRDTLWVAMSCAAAGVFMLTITAEFIYAKSATALSEAMPLVVTGGQVRILLALFADDALHRFSVQSEGVSFRFIAIRRPDQTIATAFDACAICGSQGYYQKGGNVICKNCASAINIPTIGSSGGCNPIALPSAVDGDSIVIPADKLFAGRAHFHGGSQ